MWSFGKTWSELEKGGVSKEMADIGHRNFRPVTATRLTLTFYQYHMTRFSAFTPATYFEFRLRSHFSPQCFIFIVYFSSIDTFEVWIL